MSISLAQPPPIEAPPPVRLNALSPTAPSPQAGPPFTWEPLSDLGLDRFDAMPLSFGDGESTWAENAESGSGSVIDGTGITYDLIQSDAAAEGTHAFHLANPSFADNWFELDVDIDVGPETKIFFFSQLQWATGTQVARVQVSTNGGSNWTNVYSQTGTGGSGEGAFSQKEIDLGTTYNGQQVRIRFYYDFTGGSAFTQVDTYVGWLVDDIHINTSYPKMLWSIGSPTSYEVHYVELINRARADASEEAERLRDISTPNILSSYSFFGIDSVDIVSQFAWNVSHGCMAETAQPLAIRAELTQAAQLHSQDMFNNQFQGHTSSGSPVLPILPGDDLGDRADRVGYTGWSGLAENVFAYSDDVEYGHVGFEVDWGSSTNPASSCFNAAFVGQGMQNPAGHRLSIHNGTMNEVGVGVVNGTNGSVGPQIVTQDFGSRNGVAYICGVVYDDENGDFFYSVTNAATHEGRGGIRVDVEGAPYYAVTTDSGAYAIPISSNGTYEVTFSAPGIETFATTVIVAGPANVKLDHDPVDSGYAAFALLHTLVGGPNDDDDLDGVPNKVEYVVAAMDPNVQDAQLLHDMTVPGGGGVELTSYKRAGVTDMQLVIAVSIDLMTWELPGVIPGTSIDSEDAAHITIAGEGTLDRLFFSFGAE